MITGLFLATLMISMNSNSERPKNRLEDYGAKYVQILYEFPVYIDVRSEMSLDDREKIVGWITKNGFTSNGGAWADKEMKEKSLENFRYKDLVSLNISMPTRGVVSIQVFGILDHEKGLKAKLKHIVNMSTSSGKVIKKEIRIVEKYVLKRE